MDRRNFIKVLAVTGMAGMAEKMEASPIVKAAAKERKQKKKGGFDENLVVFISDLHCNPDGHQPKKLQAVIDDILKLDPLPANVIALGDLAYLTGKVSEYEYLKPIITRLSDAGIKLTLAMGNHDRREEFASVFPEEAAKSVRKDRMVYVTSTPRADFIILDSLQQGEDRDKYIVDGKLDDEQKEWLKKTLDESTKPVFVCAHHPIEETNIIKILVESKSCCGYIYGHNHKWVKDMERNGWKKKNRIIRTLCMPSTGHWGDIGFVTFNLEKDKAVARMTEKEFYFPKPLPEGEKIPQVWNMLVEDNNGDHCTFPYME